MAPDQPPLVISAIGTAPLHEGTGDGGVGIVEGTRAGKIVTVETPAGQRDVQINLIRPSIALLIRALWNFTTTLSGALGADAVGALPIDIDLPTALAIAGSATGLAFLKDATTVLGDLKNRFPLLSGGI